VSVFADFLKKLDMPYALSVFLPESGISQEILSKPEILEILGLKDNELYKSN
jgi:hypothetical protein